jgi:ATP-dependent DNA helicase Rep
VRERWQNKLRYLLVDEYQDTNRAQYRLLKLLSGVRGAFTAVGDDDQAIYAWRGADVENLKLLQQDYPKLKVIKLEQNYRSSRRILEAANTVIANNEKLFDKRLWSEHGQGDQITVTNCRDAEHEAEWVATKITAHKFEHRTRFKDYAILYRGNHQARLIEQQLRNHRIPYVLSGGQSFFDKAEIRDLIAWLRLLVNEDDDLAFIRAITTPRRGIGAATIEALGAYAGASPLSACSPRCSRTAHPASASSPSSCRACRSSPPTSTACSTAPRASPPRSCWKTCSARSATRPGCSSTATRARPKQ